MNPGGERLDHERRVVGVGRGEVNGIDVPGLEQGLETVVVRDVLDVVHLCQSLRLLLVAGDEGGHHRIARVLDAGHEIFLGDPARADHGVADFAAIGRDL